MATVTHDFDALVGYNSGTVVAELYSPAFGDNGSPGWLFVGNDATARSITFRFTAVDYASGPMTVTLHWYCITPAASGAVSLAVNVAAQQPNVSVETARNPVPGTAVPLSPTVSTTQYAPQSTVFSVTDTDGAAAGYPCYITVNRSDTNTAEVVLYAVTVAYSDGTSAGTGDVSTDEAPGGSVVGEIVVFNDVNGKRVLGSGTTMASVVRNTGPSVVDGNIVKFSGTGGLNILDGGVAAASVVAGPASAVSGNIASYNATTGKLIQDSGVSATAHATRHNVGGADSLFPGTWGAGDVAGWNGTIWVPKFHGQAALSANHSATGAANTMQAIAGLSLALPRAGTYLIFLTAQQTTTGTGSVISYCFSFSGTITSINAIGTAWTISSGATGMILVQTANGALVSTTGNGASSLGTAGAHMQGQLVCSTAGNLTANVARVSTATTTSVLATRTFLHAIQM